MPEGYEKASYIQNATATHVDTGVYCIGNISLHVKAQSTGGGSFYILQSRASSSSPIHGIGGSATGNTINANCSGTVITSNISRVKEHIYDIRMTIANGEMSLYVKDLNTGEEDLIATSVDSQVESPSTIGVFSNGFNNVSAGHRVYSAKIIQDGVVLINYVPATKDGVAGFYDAVSGNFVIAEKGSLIAG